MNVDLMSVLVAVVAVGVGLAGLTLTAFKGLRNEMRGLRQEMQDETQGLRREMREEIQGLREETRQEIQGLRGHMVRIDTQIGDLRERMAHVEGLLTGLRDAFAQRISTELGASPPAQLQADASEKHASCSAGSNSIAESAGRKRSTCIHSFLISYFLFRSVS